MGRGVPARSPGTTLSAHAGAQGEGKGERAPARLLLSACQQLDFLPSLLGEKLVFNPFLLILGSDQAEKTHDFLAAHVSGGREMLAIQ